MRLYILCHNEQRFTEAQAAFSGYSWAVPIRMKYQNCTFENAFWKQLLEIKDEWINCEMVGALSSIAHTKVDLRDIDRIIHTPALWDSGYYHFTSNEKPIINEHPHLLTIVGDVCASLNLQIPTLSWCNYWMCAPALMERFINWYEESLLPTVMAHPLAMTDANYGRGKLTKEELIVLCGTPHYPHIPFVIERMNKAFFANITTEDSYVTRMYMIGGVDGGGSLKFLNDLIQVFPHIHRVIHKKDLVNIHFKINDILIVQHLFHDITPSMITNIYNTYKLRIIINVHDFWWFDKNSPHSAYLAPNINIAPDIKDMFDIAEIIIHPSQFTFNEYAKYFPSENFMVSPHIDFAILDSPLSIPPVTGTINIGCMHEFSEYKGKEYILYLQNTIKQYKMKNINILSVGNNIPVYKENEFFELIKKHNIHCLFLLNKWGETYCYSLSKYLKSGLPILYNSIGAVVERIPDVQQYKKVFDTVIEFNTANKMKLETKLTEMLDFIIENNHISTTKYIDLSLLVPPLYKHIFDSVPNTDIIALIHNKIKPFCIYFPQFHSIKENDYNYYPGMTDMTNLIAYLKYKGANSVDSPDINALRISGLDQYDLTNKSIIMKQINIAKTYGIYGFSVYYYWFTYNNITNKHTIMESCYNNFFEETIDNFKVYFDWANEDWTKNPAFTSKDSVNISNVYTRDTILANFNNLKRYFLHPNYYKIDNAPVFGIHHPFLISDSDLQLVESIFTEECYAMGFAGIHIIKNSMVKQYDKSFLMAPNYKIPRLSPDYTTYIPNSYKNDVIHTMFFSFNNTVRMFKPSKPHISKVTNVTPTLQLQYLKAIINSYKGTERIEINKIMLINSWNEWGEDMAIEPSDKKGCFYLDMIKRCLLEILL